ncbi:MAG: class I mannose-6-phosphate isomerase [Bacteroidales bacterium]|nr:class I mannose-6-phosphate isomerase [Bacteroidales bacterium]
MENQKLTPLKFLPDVQEMPWGTVEYKLADLGFVDSMACEGWLKGNSLSDIMQTYLERLVGETAFAWYGTQFPVMVKRLTVRGRNSLHVNPDDETAGQRYDAFGKTALWYVEAIGPDARLYMGFKRPVSAEEFYRACMTGKVEPLLHSVTPRVGECYLVRPGLVHAAKDVTLLEIAESSELWFRLYDWGKTERELHLEEAFDLIDLKGKIAGHAAGTDATEQFTVNAIPLTDALKSHRDEDDTFLLYVCVKGAAVVQADGTNYGLKTGEVVLVPAEVSDFFLLPAEKDTMLLEVRMDPRSENDIVSAPVEE